MLEQTPLFLFAFANDEQNRLNLNKERDQIESILDQINHIKFKDLPRTDQRQLYKRIIRYSKNISLFHYAGHANSQFLKLVEGKVHYGSLATLFGTLDQLNLVFLNGCATGNQVEELLEAKVPAVIATLTEVFDHKAILFSTTFYESLAAQSTILQAFNRAKAVVQNDFPDIQIETEQYTARGYGFYQLVEESWKLFYRDEAYLDTQLVVSPQPLPPRTQYHSLVEVNHQRNNLKLMLAIFRGLKEQLPEKYGAIDLARVERGRTAKDNALLVDTFPTFIGIHIRDLLSISSAGKNAQSRIQFMLAAYLSLVKYLIAILLIKVWKAALEEDLFVHPTHLEEIKEFLMGANLAYADYDYWWLFRTLYLTLSLHDESPFQNQDHPLHYGLGKIGRDLVQHGPFYKATEHFEFHLRENFNPQQFNQIPNDQLREFHNETTNHLCTILAQCAFLGKYDLVSIKGITVDNPYQIADLEKFIHQKITLRGNYDPLKDDQEKFKEPFNNNAVILTDGLRNENPLILPLSPFLIDINGYSTGITDGNDEYFVYFLSQVNSGTPVYHSLMARNLKELDTSDEDALDLYKDLDILGKQIRLFIETLKL